MHSRLNSIDFNDGKQMVVMDLGIEKVNSIITISFDLLKLLVVDLYVCVCVDVCCILQFQSIKIVVVCMFVYLLFNVKIKLSFNIKLIHFFTFAAHIVVYSYSCNNQYVFLLFYFAITFFLCQIIYLFCTLNIVDFF